MSDALLGKTQGNNVTLIANTFQSEGCMTCCNEMVDLKVKRPLMVYKVAQRSRARVCGRSLAGIAGSNSAGAWMVFRCECCVCCQVEVSATG